MMTFLSFSLWRFWIGLPSLYCCALFMFLQQLLHLPHFGHVAADSLLLHLRLPIYPHSLSTAGLHSYHRARHTVPQR